MNWFFSDVFLTNYYICVDYTVEEMEKAIFDQFEVSMSLRPNSVASCVEVTAEDGRYGIFIRIKNNDFSSLVHESVHAANMTFQRIGHEISVENDEVQAYYTQFLFNKISKFFKLEAIDGGSF